MERDSMGLGDGTNAASMYKSVVLVDTHSATNIANTGYDLEKGAPNALSLPTNTALVAIAPVARQDLVQIVNSNELARFGSGCGHVFVGRGLLRPRVAMEQRNELLV